MPATAQQALALLQGAAEAAQGLAPATLGALAALDSWPSCLLPLLLSIAGTVSGWHGKGNSGEKVAYLRRVQAILVAALGRLDYVWADQQLKNVLLGLPLPAMQLLLSSDELTVGSEDTVMYTAQQYVSKQQGPAAQQEAKDALAELVRCPHLSRFCLSSLALATDAKHLLLSHYQGQLRQLLSLQLVATDAAQTASSANGTNQVQKIAGAPASWQFSRRQLCTPGPVSVVWRLPVQWLAETCRSYSCAQTRRRWWGTASPPKGGYAWQVMLELDWQGEGDQQGVRFSLFGGPVGAPDNTFCSVKLAVAVGGDEHTSGATCFIAADWQDAAAAFRGGRDYFSIGPMPGGWDEAAWAAKGLPTSGVLEIKLTVHEVSAC